MCACLLASLFARKCGFHQESPPSRELHLVTVHKGDIARLPGQRRPLLGVGDCGTFALLCIDSWAGAFRNRDNNRQLLMKLGSWSLIRQEETFKLQKVWEISELAVSVFGIQIPGMATSGHLSTHLRSHLSPIERILVSGLDLLGYLKKFSRTQASQGGCWAWAEFSGSRGWGSPMATDPNCTR